MKNKIIIGLVVILAIFAVFYYLNNKKSVDNKTEKGDVIKIGGAFGLSSYCADFGEGEKMAVELAIDEVNSKGGVNGKKIELFIEDTQCDNKGTVNAISKLVNIDKIDAIIGPTWGDSYQSGFPLLRKEKIVAISPSAAMESLEFTKSPIDYVYSTWFPQRIEINLLQETAKKRSLNKFIIINDNDPFAEMMVDLFKKQSVLNGIEVLYSEKVNAGTDDFKTIITKVKSYPDVAIFASFFSPDSKARFLKQMRDLGLKNQVFSSSDIENPDVLNAFRGSLDGVIFASPVISQKADFINKFKNKYGVEPRGPSVGQAYDAINILLEALRKNGVNNLEETLLEVSVPGVTVDTVNFNEKHQVSGGKYIMKTVKNNQFVELE